MKSAQNIKLGSFLISIKCLILCVNNVVNIRELHNNISIALSNDGNTNFEVIPPLSDLNISLQFHVLLVPTIHHILCLSYLHTYRPIGIITHLLLTNGVSVKYELSTKIQHIFDQKSSMTCGWALLWNIYHKRAPNLGGLNKYLDLDIATISNHPNEELSEFYTRNIIIQKNIDLSKAIMSPDILIKCYLDILM